MNFSPPPPRNALSEPLLPMINVVFLLLIFFLISARMTPPEPFEVSPPEAIAVEEAGGSFTLYLNAEGMTGYRDVTGLAAMEALSKARVNYCDGADCQADPPRLTLRADAALPAASLAKLLPQLAELGFAEMELATTGPTR